MRIIFILQFTWLMWIVNGCSNNESAESFKKEYEPTFTKAFIAFNNNIHDFGDVKEDELLIAKFPFVNTGADTLIIDYVNPDCTCTGFELSADSIAPNEAGFINLKFDTKGKIGPQKVYAIVRANDSIRFHRLLVKANVIIKN